MRRALRTAATAAVATGALAAPAAGAVQVSHSGWSWGNPQPQGNTIRAMDFAAGRGYAVGNAGTALRTDDGGATWRGLATGTSLDLDRLQVVDADTVIVQGGGGCVVRRTDDGGATFRRIFVLAEARCPDPVQAAWFVSRDVGYLVLRNGTVLRTTDAGETFERRTAIPGTPARADNGGTAVPADAVFTDADTGVVFLAGGAVAYRTTDRGQSWNRVDSDPGDVRRMARLDATTLVAVGRGTLLRSDDAGLTWRGRAGAGGADLTSISCAGTELCLLTTTEGDRLLRTDDGGATTTPLTAATQALHAAAFTSPTRAVAAGAGGATVTSDDGGRTYAPVGGDIGGSFPFGMRTGPDADTAFALGARGQLARTTDGGATWRALAVATSASLRDVSFATADVGYVLDQRGGLVKTSNAGQSWQTLDPGTTSPPRAVLALGGDVVLLASRDGIHRAVGNRRFEPVRSAALRSAGALTRLTRAGDVVAAFGARGAAVSSDRGATWRRIRLPGKRSRIRDLDAVTASRLVLLDSNARLLRTRDGGRTWSELPAIGTDDARSIAFPSATTGYVTLGRFAGRDGSVVLRTSDGGTTWRPQRISTGGFATTEGVAAPTPTRAFAVTGTPSAGDVMRSLFATSTGGDAGTASRLTLGTHARRIGARRLKRQGGRVTVRGSLPGAQGGEQIVVSARSAGAWRSRVVQAGANDGSFTATFPITRSTTFVAQWAGDSGRRGAGSRALRIRVVR